MPSENLFTEITVSWTVEDIEVAASLTLPTGAGPFPAVIFVAGSGPTDRNWNSPLIPGSNGSGGLLARSLAAQGFVTLRYDKRASGPHVAEAMKQLMGKISMQGHLKELAGGVRLLASRAEVDPGRLFALTNSEGCVHALNYQTGPDEPHFAGMVLTSAFAQPTGALAHSQIAAQLAPVPGGDALLAVYDRAIAEFTAGRPAPIDETLPESLRQLIQAINQPINQPFSRELWVFNPIEKLAEVSVPVLIVLGKKDIQVDWQTDGPVFEALAKAHPNLTLFYAENANHVLKSEPKPRADLTVTEVMTSYGAAEVGLDPSTVETIIAWLNAPLER